MQRDARGVGVAWKHVGEGKARIIILHVPAAWETFGRREATFEVF